MRPISAIAMVSGSPSGHGRLAVWWPIADHGFTTPTRPSRPGPRQLVGASRKVSEMTGRRFNPVITLAPVPLLVALAFFWFSHTVADPDLWGHIRFGQDILRTGSIIQRDDYSYRTGGHPWINHEWLSEVIFAGLYDHAGTAGLIVLKVLLGLVLLWLCYAHLRRHRLGPLLSVLLLALVAFPFRMGLGTIRPQLFTYLLFLIQLVVLERWNEEGGYGIWVLPVVYSFWVNLHGGVLAGIGALGIWVIVRVAEGLGKQAGPLSHRLGRLTPIGLLCAACGLALLANPYRVAIVEFLIRTGTVPRPEIDEWAPIGLTSFPGLLFLGVLAIGVLGLTYSTRKRDPAATLIWIATAIMPMVSQRHYPLFALALVIVIGEHIADVGNRWLPPMLSRFGNSRLTASACLAAAALLFGLPASRLGCIRIDPFYFPFPARAVALLERCGVRGNIAVPFAWGEYVIWHLGPGVKVSIDGRRETVYQDESYQQSLDFERGTGRWDTLLKTTTTDLVLARNGSPTANLISLTNNWVPLYQDTFSVLFVREGFSGLTQIVETPVPSLPDNGDGLCFPDPGSNGRGLIR
jgi:hypothetical protein